MFIKSFLTPIVDDIDKWAQQYDLTIETYPCKKCGTTLVTDTPFVTKDMVGLYAKTCECGNDKTPFTFTFK